MKHLNLLRCSQSVTSVAVIVVFVLGINRACSILLEWDTLFKQSAKVIISIRCDIAVFILYGNKIANSVISVYYTLAVNIGFLCDIAVCVIFIC